MALEMAGTQPTIGMGLYSVYSVMRGNQSSEERACERVVGLLALSAVSRAGARHDACVRAVATPREPRALALMAAAPTEDSLSALAVVLDCGAHWCRRKHEDRAQILEQLLLFLNAYHLHSASSLLTVFATHEATVRRLWPPGDGEDAAPGTPQQLRAAVAAGVESLAAEAPPDGSSGDVAPLLSAALSAALCRLQRAKRLRAQVEPRVLLVSAAADSPAQYLPTMNCIFGAQKLGVLIDAVNLDKSDSMLLQQAAHLTGGLYLRPDEPTQRALAQYLISCCLPDRFERQFVRAPPQKHPETRALCYLSKQPVEMGWACSICLTVFEDDVAVRKSGCPVCGSRFISLQPGGPAKKKRKTAPAAAAAPTAAAEPG